jgi:hypothetical protein
MTLNRGVLVNLCPLVSCGDCYFGASNAFGPSQPENGPSCNDIMRKLASPLANRVLSSVSLELPL